MELADPEWIQPFSARSAIVFLSVGACMIFYFRYEKERLERQRVVEASKGVGRPKVGGVFDLVDHDGKKFTDEDMKGGYSLVSDPSARCLEDQAGTTCEWARCAWGKVSCHEAMRLQRFGILHGMIYKWVVSARTLLTGARITRSISASLTVPTSAPKNLTKWPE